MAALLTSLGISIHAPREGGDRGNVKIIVTGPNISIHAPREGGDCWLILSRPYGSHFNPRPPRGGRPRGNVKIIVTGPRISIHAPREGGDNYNSKTKTENKNFNPRPPRGGRLLYGRFANQSWYFNPRPPRGGRLASSAGHATHDNISIHAPREGGDFLILGLISSSVLFQSTPPARGATT